MVNYHNADLAHRHAEIGYLLRRDRWGQGLAREAVGAVLGHCFGAMGLHRVQAVIDPENVASRRLVEGFGFKQEGVLRETLFLGGAWRDDVIYGLLAREWGAKT
jgi:RimJ/RimL family protein N-acetyltransferase